MGVKTGYGADYGNVREYRLPCLLLGLHGANRHTTEQSAVATVAPADLKNQTFQVALNVQPDSAWSGCVNSTGKVPLVTIKTTVSLNGTSTSGEQGKFSGGAVGDNKKDLKKALTVHFEPEWRTCT